MALIDIDQNGNTREVLCLDHRQEFDVIWFSIPLPERIAIEGEINGRLDALVASPDPDWGSITNTSLEGAKTNPETGIRGDWTGTVFDSIFRACGLNEQLAGMFFGNVWKKV